MCWITTKETVPIIAKKDVHVYKVMKLVDGTLLSYFQNMKYELNKLNKLPSTINLFHYQGNTSIDKGFHSYATLDYVKKTDVKNIYQIRINRVIDYTTAKYSHVVGVAKCTIPKGSMYYKNERDEIVSDQIIINEFKTIQEICAG